MRKLIWTSACLLLLACAGPAVAAFSVADGGFEDPLPGGPNKFGKAFKSWEGWIWSAPARMEPSPLAHSGKLSAMVVCGMGGTARYYEQERSVPPGRYRLTFYVRGLDIQLHWEKAVSMHFYDGKWIMRVPDLLGTFGWRKVTYVGDVPKEVKERIYLGLDGAGRVWFDDVTVEEVGNDVPLTPKPVVGPEEAPITPPGELVDGKWVRCAECGYRCMPEWKTCYACGTALAATPAKHVALPPKLICGFERPEPGFSAAPAQYVEAHATEGTRSVRWDPKQEYLNLARDLDWTGYDYFKVDYFLDSDDPVDVSIEIRDVKSSGYWDRVNYYTKLLPGQHTLELPTALYVGEKSRPGRALMLNAIKFIAFGQSGKRAPVYLDNLRLECDRSETGLFEGLLSFHLGTASAALFPGMLRVTDSTLYSKGRGYGLKDARVWRSMDVLQPDPIYRDFLCITKGGLAVDLPNGNYTVFVNHDCPGGYWGELPVYRKRTILAQGKVVSEETMDRERAIANYFRFADSDDRPVEDTFDKYLGVIFREKKFEAEVTDGQLVVAFEGPEWAHCVSCIVIYPSAKRTEGERYLSALRERRRAEFNRSFQRLLHQEKRQMPPVSAADQKDGCVVFMPGLMEDVYDNTLPRAEDIGRTARGSACAGQIGSLCFALRGLKDLGTVSVAAADLRGPATIPADRIRIGCISNRITRVTADGSVYTIRPRYVMDRSDARLDKDSSVAFLANVRVPAGLPRGLYRGKLDLSFEKGGRLALDVEFEVLSTKPLDEADLPVGPWGLEIRPPWYAEELKDWGRAMDERCLTLMREYGMNTFSAALRITPVGRGRDMTLAFTRADEIMALARKHGMKRVQNYGTFVEGLNLYGYPKAQDPKALGFDDLSALYAHVFRLVNAHAEQAGWLPLGVNICDEPLGGDTEKAAANAALLRPLSTPRVTLFGATSLRAADLDGKTPEAQAHVALCRALPVANLNNHDARSIAELRKSGAWAFYNGANRWTYGGYLFMLRRTCDVQFRLGWHWNCNAGDPYYALDCREDDYCWANANARGGLVTSLEFERLREGVNDYRFLQTLERLAKDQPAHPAAAGVKTLVDKVTALKPGDDRPMDSAARGFGWRELRAEAETLLRQFAQ